MTAPVTKAVFPVAGLGTRFLPATKAQPKEMLPVVDKPLIQYAVEEAYEAGIRHMIFVTGRNKRAIEDHFDTAYELETELESAGKQALLDLVRSVQPADMLCSCRLVGRRPDDRPNRGAWGVASDGGCVCAYRRLGLGRAGSAPGPGAPLRHRGWH